MNYHNDFQRILKELANLSDYIKWNHRTGQYTIKSGAQAYLHEHDDSIGLVVVLYDYGTLQKNFDYSNPDFPNNMLKDIEIVGNLCANATIADDSKYLISNGFKHFSRYGVQG